MMGHGSVSLLRSVAAGLLLIGLLAPMAARAAEQGWATVVESKSEAMRRHMQALPSAPPPGRIKPATKPVAAPLPQPKPQQPKTVAKVDVPALVPVDESEITTGAINPAKSDPALSATDAARLFNDDANTPANELTTGTVDGQGADLARSYCVSISSAAADTRTAMQMSKLAEMEKQVGRRIAALEAKTAEYKSWVERREQILKRATTSLVKIYTQMEPDAAALQFVSMEEETAASILFKLEPASASAILNEMAPEKAARLAAGIAGAARLVARPTPPPPAPQAPPPNADAPERAYPGEGRS